MPLLASARPWLWLLLLTGILAGCAALPSGPPEDVVKARAQARWEALVAGQWDKAYEYMAPSYRALVERKRFANQFGGGAAWQGAEVIKVTCEQPVSCTARIKILYRSLLDVRGGEPMSTHFDETWIREDGQWWLFQKL